MPATISKSYTLGFVDEVAPDIGVCDGKNMVYTLSAAPLGKAWVTVYINGLAQAPRFYSLAGATLTLTFAPDAAADLWVRYGGEFLQ